MSKKCGVSITQALLWANLHSSKFYAWKRSLAKTSDKKSKPIPREHYLLPEERQAIVQFKVENPHIGYRRLTWMMVDQEVVCVSPASVLRVLTENGLNIVWTRPGGAKKPHGFIQPTKVHQHWHVDIAYINVLGSFMFLISVLDGYSRYILFFGQWGKTWRFFEDLAIFLFRWFGIQNITFKNFCNFFILVGLADKAIHA